tara:strand:- start:2417 stop:3166 length:750 start_codon:yes stop_codon:yes gene_type:complete
MMSNVRQTNRTSRLLKVRMGKEAGKCGVSSEGITRKRIFLVDDHPAFRMGLGVILSTEFDLEICGEASSVDEALLAIADTRPDLVVTDISMPGTNGLDLIRRMKAASADTKVLAMSVHDDAKYALPVRQAGGHGYVNKETPAEEIVAAIHGVLAGRMVFQQRDLIETRRRGLPDREASGVVDGIEFLTHRELEVFELLGHGRSTRETADELGMGVKTAEVHRSRIRRKLGCGSSAELIHAAYRWIHERG